MTHRAQTNSAPLAPARHLLPLDAIVGCSILIVEDTMTVAALIRIYLAAWCADVRVAGNGNEALALALERTPDLVLSDVQMPEMDGFTLCVSLRTHPELHRVPVILLTSMTDEASRLRGRLSGAQALLPKPINPEELRSKVAALLNLDPVNGTPR